MRKVCTSKVSFEEGFSSGRVDRTGSSVVIHLLPQHAGSWISFSEAEFQMFRGLIMKAVEAIEVSKP